VVWHHSKLLMNSFNKTEAAVFSCRLCFLRAFPFICLNPTRAVDLVIFKKMNIFQIIKVARLTYIFVFAYIYFKFM